MSIAKHKKLLLEAIMDVVINSDLSKNEELIQIVVEKHKATIAALKEKGEEEEIVIDLETILETLSKD